jgi:hypothetical protein
MTSIRPTIVFSRGGRADMMSEHEPNTAQQEGRARAFIRRAAASMGRSDCRAVIVHPKSGEPWKVGSAEYPHPRLARVVFRTVDVDAMQFIAELLPE